MENFAQLAKHLIENPVNYRYSRAEYAIQALEEETLLFSHASIFNDPFDCDVNLFEFNREDVANHHKEIIKKHKGSDYLERFRLIRNLNSKILPQYKEFMQQIFKTENADRGVTCFSKNCINLLMWAHYANNHTGMCIGYDLAMLRDFIHTKNPESCLLPVNYVEKIIPMENFRTENSIQHWFGTKNRIWSYEEEIRFIAGPLNFEENRYAYKIPKEVFKEVSLGISISDKDKEAIANLVKKRFQHVRIYQMVADYTTFDLKRKEINF